MSKLDPSSETLQQRNSPVKSKICLKIENNFKIKVNYLLKVAVNAI